MRFWPSQTRSDDIWHVYSCFRLYSNSLDVAGRPRHVCLTLDACGRIYQDVRNASDCC